MQCSQILALVGYLPILGVLQFYLDINILFWHCQHVLCNQRYCAQAFFVPCCLQSVKYILLETYKQGHYDHILLRCSYPTYRETVVAFDFFIVFGSGKKKQEIRMKIRNCGLQQRLTDYYFYSIPVIKTEFACHIAYRRLGICPIHLSNNVKYLYSYTKKAVKRKVAYL